MKAYLVTTGSIFALMAALHVWKAIDEYPGLATDPWHYLIMSAMGVAAAALTAWACRLLYRDRR